MCEHLLTYDFPLELDFAVTREPFVVRSREGYRPSQSCWECCSLSASWALELLVKLLCFIVRLKKKIVVVNVPEAGRHSYFVSEFTFCLTCYDLWPFWGFYWTFVPPQVLVLLDVQGSRTSNGSIFGFKNARIRCWSIAFVRAGTMRMHILDRCVRELQLVPVDLLGVELEYLISDTSLLCIAMS
ncbi:hypothetical protein BJ508DRAFT_314028 [Ascobolus immersus RN42]|uniref:Uncharacterized protein n=1 Tax=Ascobolus immersus RN42 TaxID=1160509 RepID=A0A3N4HKV8_ASCIM|nr:hypothetical protein BJ508DRAFT_314028 [Ascobolus immersus RN42]